MELIRGIWFVSFCSFALTLIFIWSKIVVIKGRISGLEKLLAEINSVGKAAEEEKNISP